MLIKLPEKTSLSLEIIPISNYFPTEEPAESAIRYPKYVEIHVKRNPRSIDHGPGAVTPTNMHKIPILEDLNDMK